MKISKQMCSLLLFAVLAAGTACESSNEFSPKDLNDLLANAIGAREYVLKSNIDLVMQDGENTLLGADCAEELVIDGQGTATITAVGEINNIIKANSQAMLVMKNVKIIDETTGEGGYGWYANYLDWGGNLRFENCVFDCSIFLTDTNARFQNCQFISKADNLYSVWVGDGSATFENCTFTGYRGLKIHDSGTNADVVSVTVDGCLFDNLSVKPGLAIGSVWKDVTSTFITVKNCTFNGCQPWDQIGSVEGVDGVYESDTLSKSETVDYGFVFTLENNEVKRSNE